MSPFEFLFALFGLLLGLSLAEVLGGLARSIEVRLRPGSTIRIGWLTPLLGLFVLLDLLSFWSAAWFSREAVAVGRHSLLGVMSFAGAYYLAATLVFPRELEGELDLDHHFFRVRRIVIGVMLGLLAAQYAFYASVPAMGPLITAPFNLVVTGILVALMIAALIVRGEWWTRWVMVALVARYLVVYLL